MYTWRRGSRLLFEKSRKLEFPLADLVGDAGEAAAAARAGHRRVPDQSDPQSAPTALMHSLKHYKVLHEKNVILTIENRADAAHRSGRAGADGCRSARPSPR